MKSFSFICTLVVCPVADLPVYLFCPTSEARAKEQRPMESRHMNAVASLGWSHIEKGNHSSCARVCSAAARCRYQYIAEELDSGSQKDCYCEDYTRSSKEALSKCFRLAIRDRIWQGLFNMWLCREIRMVVCSASGVDVPSSATRDLGGAFPRPSVRNALAVGDEHLPVVQHTQRRFR